MSLNIKNERTHALVRELAELTGQSQTSAVEAAVERYLQEIRARSAECDEDRRREARRERIDRALQDLWAHTPPDPDFRREADEALYDEAGLPR